MKMQYVAPVLEEVGSFEAVTLATGNQNQTDATFPVGTPIQNLTFS
jgi:hypothetical protein